MVEKNFKPSSPPVQSITEKTLISLMLDTALEVSNVYSLEFVGACLHNFFSRFISDQDISVVIADSILNGFFTIPGGQVERLTGIDEVIFNEISSRNPLEEYDSYRLFPLRTSSRCYGFVRIEVSPALSGLSPDTLEKLDKFMHLVAIGVENSQRISKAERALSERDSQLIIMHEMGELIGSISDIDHLNAVIINMVKEVMNVHLCSIMIFESDGESETQPSFILLPEDRDRVGKDILNTWRILGVKCRELQKPVLVNNPHQADNVSPIDLQIDIELPCLTAPLRVNQKVIGVLNVCNKFFGEYFTISDIDFLAAFTNQVSKALENAKLHQNLQSFAFMTISSLMSVIETKDPFMKGHSERVAVYSKKLAEAIEPPLDQRVITMIEYAAILHDIGKVGVAKEILHKKAPLLEQEIREIKKHPSIGKKILRPLKFLEEAGILIDHHQERYDGKGYPEGLAGKAIPLGARIIAIADSFDAMTSMRPYRNRLPLEKARYELTSNAGKQFDPELVEIFLKLIDNGIYKPPEDELEQPLA